MTFPIGGVLPALLMLGAFMVTAAACGSEPQSVRIATVEHPDQSLVVAGFERELGHEICARAGLECSWTTAEVATILADLYAEEHDVLTGRVMIADPTDGQYLFTQPYLPSGYKGAGYAIGPDSTLTLTALGTVTSSGVGAVVRRSDCRLQARLDQTIAAMKTDGSLNATVQKWFGPAGPIFQ